MLALYGARGSGAAAIEAALTIAGLPYRFVEAATWLPGSGLEELKRVNPLGQIPTLVLEDGSVLSESAAILIHLGLTVPASGLLPASASKRAQAIRGLVYIAANCYAAIGVFAIRSVGAPSPMRRRQPASAPEHARACTICGRYLPTPSRATRS